MREDDLLDVGESADAHKLGLLALVDAQQLIERGRQLEGGEVFRRGLVISQHIINRLSAKMSQYPMNI